MSALSNPIDLHVTQRPTQALYLSNSSLSSTEGNNVTVGEILTFRVAIAVPRGSTERVFVNVTVPSSVVEGFLNITDATLLFVGGNVVRTGLNRTQLTDHWYSL